MRASSNRPLDWSGSPQQSCFGTSTSKPLCSRICHDLLPLPRLVVLGAAPVEVDDLAPGRRTRSSARPAREAPAGELRRGRVAVNFQQLLGQNAQRSQLNRQVGQRRHRCTGAAEPGRAGDDPVAERDALLALELVARLGIDLGDLHSLGARLRADAAPGAVVDRPLDRRLVGDAVALGLGAGVLRPGEQRSHVGHRTLGLADRALDAVIDRSAEQVVEDPVAHAAAPAPAPDRDSTSCAAR